ncbi:MAG: NAD kinase [Bacteroidetes bacterium]|nr:MAG: NAD kinase [Bacteroidota bacterium]
MQVVVFGKQYKEKDLPYIQALFDALHQGGITTYIYAPYLESLIGKVNFKGPYAPFDGYRDFLVHRIDFVVVLGGDGTMLQAVTVVRDAGVPMLGINLGRLGFLASTEKHFIELSIRKLLDGHYTVNERTMLYLESAPALFGEIPFALNDCTLLKRDTSSMITIHTFLNGDYLNSYWADGIIISTPTGSTAYSLSCGGPIVLPNSGNFVITPVAPHNLNLRPIVLSDKSILSFEIEGRAENFICTLDSRFELITAAHQLAVRRNDFCIKLVQLQDESFLQTLREKLTWGTDLRN